MCWIKLAASASFPAQHSYHPPLCSCYHQWQEAQGGVTNASRKILVILSFFSKNFRQKIQNLGIKILIVGGIWGQIEILSTHDVLCWKVAVVRRKIATFRPVYFLTNDAAGYHTVKIITERSHWPPRGLPPCRGGGAYAPRTRTICNLKERSWLRADRMIGTTILHVTFQWSKPR